MRFDRMVIANQRHIETLGQARLCSEDSPLLAPEAYDRLADFLGAPSQTGSSRPLAITVIAPRALALQPNGLKRFAIALGAAAVEVGGTSTSPSTGRPTNSEYVILLPHRAHQHPATITEGLRQAILRHLDEADVTAPNMLSMRVHKLDPANV